MCTTQPHPTPAFPKRCEVANNTCTVTPKREVEVGVIDRGIFVLFWVINLRSYIIVLVF